jgi:hypothetical protein
MREIARYRFVYSPIFLGLYVILMLISSINLNVLNFETLKPETLPLLSKIFNTESLTHVWSAVVVIGLILLTSALLYFFNTKVFNCGKPALTAPLIFIIFVLTPPSTLVFSGSFLAAPLVLTSIYISLFTKDNDRNIVFSVFLISTATLFDFHLLLIVPLIFYYSLQSSSFELRNIVIALLMLALPYVFTISARHLFFGDSGVIIDSIVNDFRNISAPVIKVDNVAGGVLMLSFLLIFWRSIIMVGKLSGTYKILKSAAVSRNVAFLIVMSIVSVLYPAVQPGFFFLISIPFSLLVSEYVTHESTSSNRRVEFLVLLILIAINRLSALI